jgi:hypothetical protein
MALKTLTTLVMVAAVAWTGCAKDIERTLRERGAVCVLPDGATTNLHTCERLEFSADEILRLEVHFDVCLSATCDVDRRASCRANVDGSVITVTAEGSYRRDGDDCSDDCGALTATCSVGPLPAGDYEVRYAEDSLALTLPSTRAKVCTTGTGGCCDSDADCAEGTCFEGTHCVVPE